MAPCLVLPQVSFSQGYVWFLFKGVVGRRRREVYVAKYQDKTAGIFPPFRHHHKPFGYIQLFIVATNIQEPNELGSVFSLFKFYIETLCLGQYFVIAKPLWSLFCIRACNVVKDLILVPITNIRKIKLGLHYYGLFASQSNDQPFKPLKVQTLILSGFFQLQVQCGLSGQFVFKRSRKQWK